MEVDYIVVGFGLAGMSFVSHLEANNKTFVVFDNNENRPTRVVGGMYNPIILKRFTPAWHAHEMWGYALPFYKKMEKQFAKSYIKPIPIKRILHSVEEQNNWVVASEKPVMSEYMNPEISKESIKGLSADYGFGNIHDVGRVEGDVLLNDYKNVLISKGVFLNEEFDYNLVQISEKVVYKTIKAKTIIFSVGSYLHHNPFFNFLPMREAKGELLLIEIPDLDINFTIKSSVFMIPYGKNKYMVGATYNWEDKTYEPTESAKLEIETKLRSFLKLPYKIIERRVGIRPTVKDRRPLIGKHPKYEKMAVLNGLGTRGIIIAPLLAKQLYEYLEHNKPIDSDMNSNRFESLYTEN